MAQINTRRRYSLTLSSVTNAGYTQATGFQKDGAGISLPDAGEVYEIHVTLASGPATQAAIRLRQGAGGRVVAAYPLTSFPISFGDPGITFETSDLYAEAITDNAGASDLDFEIVASRSA